MSAPPANPVPPGDPFAHPVVIVGGGVTGLSAAWRLRRAGMPFVVLEASDRFGGKVRTERAGGYTLEMGADAFLLRKPWARQLAVELGLDERVQPVERPPVSTYVLHRGRPVALPAGMPLLVPSRWGPFLRSPLFSIRGKLRVALEPLIAVRRDDADESLERFITRRLGREMLERVAEPMLAGVFNGEAGRQSMRATFPQFPAMEREHGSLIRGVRARRAATAATDERPFFSFRGGAQELIDVLVERLHDGLCRNAAVARVDRDGDAYRVELASGESIAASAVLFATPASVAAAALADVAPHAASLLRQLRHVGIGTAYVAYRRADVPHPLDAYGIVIPRRERRGIDGLTFSTTKWAARAPEDHALIRVFFGGPHTRAAIDLDDDALLAVVRRELAAMLGVRAAPLLWRVHRWADGYPQYDLGHLDRVAAIDAALPPGLAVAGSPYRGVGVPDCVRQGTEAAERLIAFIHKDPA